ncbi:MAG: MotA/TolQ/ExbB proton channel family protein [Candidatus Methylomirabilis sp.]|nr:MotA/TolQ/ExbB proton channel family protein [Deltaproteobacteria bacterium]
MDAIAEFYQSGGTWMHPILVMAVFGLAVAVERLYFLMIAYNINGERLFSELKKYVLADKINDAVKLCDSAPLPSILRAGLVASQGGPRAAEKAMDEAALEVIPRIEKRTHYLSMVANVATLMGLLGTIFGLIIAFKAVAIADPSQKADQLAKGISVAMNTTAFGLVIAIPLLIVHSYLSAKATRLLDQIDEYTVKLLGLLDAAGRKSGKEPAE